ncbi:hypothetical protein [Rhodoferax mekongensis]|uniref:hypothetical protein n=1 Tax=Rhodoferax mekongensis TaxID=3068341 RepID=UPI0028BE7E1B|nr:hypothetical protein [Rhodoferax sp. TBRC 17199]MDT7514694.1 hypothetical protein [Rhodoferax sp. TBRC 17199]
MIKLPRDSGGLSDDIKGQLSRVKVNESMLSYAKSVAGSAQGDLLKAFGGPKVADEMREFLVRQKIEEDERRLNLPREVSRSHDLLFAPAREQRKRDKEILDLTRRQVEATEAALDEARRQAADSARETKRAYAIAVVGCLVGLASILAPVLPTIFEWIP